MDEFTVVMRARDFVRQANIESVPVDLNRYLSMAGAQLKVRTEMRDEEAGQTMPLSDHYLICVNGNHSNERQRFTILHEIAHIVLDLPSTHGDSLDVNSLGSYERRPREEILCDVFASECLLPYIFFKDDVRRVDLGLDAVCDLAAKYDASLTSTASRYAANSDEACIMVLSEKGIIRYISASPRMRELGFWVDYGVPVPQGSVIQRLMSTGAQRDYEELPAYIWTNKDALAQSIVCEEACTLGRWNQGLSLLWFDEETMGADDSARQYSEEDKLLPELDGVLPWPSKRRRK